MAFGYGIEDSLGVRYTPGGAAPHPPGMFNFEAYVISFTPIFLVNDYQHCWECTFDGFVSPPSYRYVHCGNYVYALAISVAQPFQLVQLFIMRDTITFITVFFM